MKKKKKKKVKKREKEKERKKEKRKKKKEKEKTKKEEKEEIKEKEKKRRKRRNKKKKKKIKKLTSFVHGPFTNLGFNTFCQRWRHWVSSLPSRCSAIFFQLLPLCLATASLNFWSYRLGLEKKKINEIK